MHLALFGLLIWSSLYQTVEIMGGGEGEGDAMGAVMVDTGSAAQEWGRIQQQKKVKLINRKTRTCSRREKPEPEPEPNQQEIAKQEEIKRQQEIQRQKELEKQKQQEIEKQNSNKNLLVKRR